MSVRQWTGIIALIISKESSIHWGLNILFKSYTIGYPNHAFDNLRLAVQHIEVI